MGSQVLEFDFPGVRVGVAGTEGEPTGCTVFHFPDRVMAAIDVRGGDPGISEYRYSHYDAICFSGGSLRGLEAAAGVRSELVEKHGLDCDLVSGAVVNDGYRRKNRAYPDKAVGALALRNARANRCPIGQVGAGRNVWVGGRRGRGVGDPERAGQGAAFRTVQGIRIAAFTVVNSFGAIHDRSGQMVRGNRISEDRRLSYLEGLEAGATLEKQSSAPNGNTTLTLLATDKGLSSGALKQVARQVHSSMARAIQPFHTIYDGDVLYMVSTGDPTLRTEFDPISLGLVASEVVWDAVLSSFAESDVAPNE